MCFASGALIFLQSQSDTSVIVAKAMYGQSQQLSEVSSDILSMVERNLRVKFLAILKEQYHKRMDIHHQYRSDRQVERAAMDSLHKETVDHLMGKDDLTMNGRNEITKSF